jgi:hypothetical protein
MSQPFDAVLEPHLGAGLSKPVAKDLDSLCEAFARILALPELAKLPPADEQKLEQIIRDRIGEHRQKIRALLREAPARPLDPRLREWALRQATPEEVLAGVKEIRETGGVTFDDILAALPPDIPRE